MIGWPYFKFQSDSINTTSLATAVTLFFALNSNLILLILQMLNEQRPVQIPLNSNLILLIQYADDNGIAYNELL